MLSSRHDPWGATHASCCDERHEKFERQRASQQCKTHRTVTICDMIANEAADACSSIRDLWLDPAAFHELQAAHGDIFKHLNQQRVPPHIQAARAELLELGLEHCCRQKQKKSKPSSAADKAAWPALRSYAAQHTAGGLRVACVRLQKGTPLSRVVAVGHLECSSSSSDSSGSSSTQLLPATPPARTAGTGVRCSHCQSTFPSLTAFQHHIYGPPCEDSSSSGAGPQARLVLLPQHWTWGTFRGALRTRWADHQAAAAPATAAAAGAAGSGQQASAAPHQRTAAAAAGAPGGTLQGSATKHAIVKLSCDQPHTPGQGAKRAAPAGTSPPSAPKKQQGQQVTGSAAIKGPPPAPTAKALKQKQQVERMKASVPRCTGLTPTTLQQLQQQHARLREVAEGRAAPTPAQAAGREALLEAGLAALRGRARSNKATRADARMLLELSSPTAPLSEALAQVLYVSGAQVKAAAQLGPGRMECCHCDATFASLGHWEVHVAGRTGYVGSLHTLLVGGAWLAGGYVTTLQERWAAEQGQQGQQGQGH